MKSFFLSALCFVTAFICRADPLLEATTTIEVVDESGISIAGAEVRISFEAEPPAKNESVKGITDANGRFTASGRTTGMVFYSARKEGCYDNVGLRYHFNKKDDGKWIPQNPIQRVLLKHVIDPLPMYVNQVDLPLPVLGSPVGFDFEVGDWVTPHGKGKAADIFFTAKCNFINLDDFQANLTITFPRNLDGLQEFRGNLEAGSILTSPQMAATSGYRASWIRSISRKPNHPRTDSAGEKDINYIFRVRTVVDEKGNLKAANYGKIYGSLDFVGFAQPRPSIKFWYYFNPKINNRSLEFDTRNNLFPDVKLPKP